MILTASTARIGRQLTLQKIEFASWKESDPPAVSGRKWRGGPHFRARSCGVRSLRAPTGGRLCRVARRGKLCRSRFPMGRQWHALRRCSPPAKLFSGTTSGSVARNADKCWVERRRSDNHVPEPHLACGLARFRERGRGQSLNIHLASPPSTQLPRNVAAPHDAHDLAPDLLSITGRHGTRLKPSPSSIIANRPLASCTDPSSLPRTVSPSSNGMEGQTPFRRELPTDALDLLTAQGLDEVGSRPEFAGGGSPALTPPHQLVFALLECIQDLSTKSAPATGLRLGFTICRSNQVAPSLVTCRSRSKAESTRTRSRAPREASYSAARASKFSGIRHRSASSRSTIPARRSASRRRT